MSEIYGVDSEVGRLRTVLVHRPGPELRRVTPRHARGLLFASVPWAERAQEEHDAFADALRRQGVAVLYLTELLQDSLEYETARQQAAEAVLSDARLGEELRRHLRAYLDGLSPEDFAQLLILGLARGEFSGGRGAVFGLLDTWDYVVDPLPNLVFARDTSVWIGDSVAVASPRGRRPEAEIASIIFAHHPQFAGTKRLYEPGLERLAGGDVLLLAPGVLAIGTGGQTSAAGMERLARRAFDAGFAHTVLAVLTEAAGAAQPGGACLDTLCTMVSPDTVVMQPAVAYSLVARTITQRGEELRLSHPQPFLAAAAQAMGIDRLCVVETGFGSSRGRAPGGYGAGAAPGAWSGAQWEDACNLLVLGPETVMSYERNVLTNARLEAEGIEVIRVPGGELAGSRGGPRAICCPLGREPLLPAPGRPRHPVCCPLGWLVCMVRAVELNVSSRSQGDHVIVTPVGEIDLYTAPKLQADLAAVIDGAAPAVRVVVDMSGVDFCDSTGMNVLLSGLRKVRERGGDLQLAALRPAVMKILQVTGLDAVFTITAEV